MNPLDSQSSSSSLHPPHYAFAHENLHQKKPSTSSRYLFPSPSPCIIPQENPHYMTMNPTMSYNHLLLPSTSYGPHSMNNYIPPSVNTHYLPHGGYAGLVNQVADGKFESKGQDQECEKEMSDEHPKKDDVFQGSCFKCGGKFHKASNCPSKGAPNDCKRKKMSDEHPRKDVSKGSCGDKFHKADNWPCKGAPNDRKRKKGLSDEHPKDDGTFRGSCYVCREKNHKAGDCPQNNKISDGKLENNGTTEGPCYRCGEEDHKAKSCPQKKKKKISDVQVKNGDHSKNGQDQSLLSPDCQQQQFTLPTHGKSLIGTIIHQLCLMRFDGEGSVCEYILEMENLVCRLRDLMMEVSNDFLVHMVLNSLPQVFDTVKLNYYSNTDTWNVNELIAHCVHEEAKHEQNA